LKKDYWNYARYANFAFSFGITMAASILLGYFGGNLLDRKLGTAPFLMLAGILLGVGVSFYSLLQELYLLEKFKPPDKEAAVKKIGREEDYQDDKGMDK